MLSLLPPLQTRDISPRYKSSIDKKTKAKDRSIENLLKSSSKLVNSINSKAVLSTSQNMPIDDIDAQPA